MQHEYLIMALQAAAKRHRVLQNGGNSDYGMDVKPSLKYTPQQARTWRVSPLLS
ncbi:hypothetical protein [Spongiibacter sp. UBA1325]|uniref:hypothetical protein n=1 Tax=Spongiibacter sp. UBA1325 TaxID=1947543 RepID=UPI00257CE090|nr:hypothetical protein [Spongiibacter sp. UBA1325]|tara:strand:+ start:3214 stop:3375 length:162 start_codon:yes stop_codon:yes gene_type:complete